MIAHRVFRFKVTTTADTNAARWSDGLNSPAFINWFVMATGPRAVEGYIRTAKVHRLANFWRLLNQRTGDTFLSTEFINERKDAVQYCQELAARTDAIWTAQSDARPRRWGGARKSPMIVNDAEPVTAEPAASLADPDPATASPAVAFASEATPTDPEASAAAPETSPPVTSAPLTAEAATGSLPAIQPPSPSPSTRAPTRRRPRSTQREDYEISIKIPRRMVRNVVAWMAMYGVVGST